MVGTLIRRPLPPVSDFIRTLLDDANATAALASLGVVSGTYLPTVTPVANIDATTAYSARYIRVGSIVVVAARVDVDATAAGGVTTIRVSLPVASDLTNTNDLGGVLAHAGVAAGGGGYVYADPGTNTAEMLWVAPTPSNSGAGFSFMYVVQ